MMTQYTHSIGAARINPVTFSQPIFRKNPKANISIPMIPGTAPQFIIGEIANGSSSSFLVFCDSGIGCDLAVKPTLKPLARPAIIGNRETVCRDDERP